MIETKPAKRINHNHAVKRRREVPVKRKVSEAVSLAQKTKRKVMASNAFSRRVSRDDNDRGGSTAHELLACLDARQGKRRNLTMSGDENRSVVETARKVSHKVNTVYIIIAIKRAE